jgi:sporulation-control protein spo0M
VIIIFGFFKGKLNVILNKHDFTPGDIIEGKMILTVKRDFESKGAYVYLSAIQQTRVNNSGKSTTRSSIIYDFKLDLENERAYTKGEVVEFPFQLKIPLDVFTPTKTQQNIIKAVSFLTGDRYSIYWSVLGKVRVRRCLTNITKKVRITVQ